MLFLLHCAQSGTCLELKQTEALEHIGGKCEILKKTIYCTLKTTRHHKFFWLE